MVSATFYETDLSLYDHDRPNDIDTYLTGKPSIHFDNLSRNFLADDQPVIDVSISGSVPARYNYAVLKSTATGEGNVYYFVTRIVRYSATAARFYLKPDPWANYIKAAGLTASTFSGLLRFPGGKVRYYSISGEVSPVGDFAVRSSNTVTDNGTIRSYYTPTAAEAKPVPVAFCEVSSGVTYASPSYPIVVYADTVGATYTANTLAAQVELLYDIIRTVNVKGNLSVTIPGASGSKTLTNAYISKVTGVYIVPFYALARLYNDVTFYTTLERFPVGSGLGYYDPAPINRYFEQFAGTDRTLTSPYDLALEAATPLYVGNAVCSVRVRRGIRKNGAFMKWSMGQQGFSLYIREVDNTDGYDLTAAIKIPNSEQTFFVNDTTSQTMKVLTGISEGASLLTSAGSIVAGVAGKNQAAIVGGATSLVKTTQTIVQNAERYKGEGYNGFHTNNAGVCFDDYIQINPNYAAAITSLPVVGVYDVRSAEALNLAMQIYSSGYPVDPSTTLEMVYIRNTGNLLTNRSGQYFDAWQFSSFVPVIDKSRQKAGLAMNYLPEVKAILEEGVRIWDTTTATKAAHFKDWAVL